LIELIKLLTIDLGLDAKIVAANDMFIGERSQNRVFAQLSTQSKYELLVKLTPEDRYLAVMSLNMHAHHFTAPLDIRAGGDQELATSLCMGVGIERLAYALACQHGTMAIRVVESVDSLDLMRRAGILSYI
jgi:hypothetical protein